MSIKIVNYHLLTFYYIYNLVSKHNYYIVLISHPGHLNPWTNLIVYLAGNKILKIIRKNLV